MKSRREKSGVLWLSVWVVACAISVGAALETGGYSYYVFAAAYLCFGVVAYRRPPLRVFANEVPASEDRRVDGVSIAGLLLLAAALVLRYAVPAA